MFMEKVSELRTNYWKKPHTFIGQFKGSSKHGKTVFFKNISK